MTDDVETRLGYRFTDATLLHLALTHPSARNELGLADDNQRLEYLGDAALGLAVAEHLYRQYPDVDEGLLTVQRSLLTSASALAETSRDLGIGHALTLGRGEDQSGGREKQNNLADALEAVIGAAYLDGGMTAVRTIFNHILADKVQLPDPGGDSTGNYKGALQEWAQKNGHPCPAYQILDSSGPAHRKTFVVEVMITETLKAVGEGPSKRAAEQAAARHALKVIMPAP